MAKPVTSLKVLIVDDHFLMRQLVHNVLDTVPIKNVENAKDGSEAIDVIQNAFDAQQPYDIVFLDWHMPTLSGLEVLTYFRNKPEYANTAFVMLTSEAEKKNIMKAMAQGAASYIIKPVSAAQFQKKLVEIHRWIEEHPSRG